MKRSVQTAGSAFIGFALAAAGTLQAQDINSLPLKVDTAVKAASTVPAWSLGVGADLGGIQLTRRMHLWGDVMGIVSREWPTSRSHIAFRTQLLVGASTISSPQYRKQFGSLSEQIKYSFGPASFRPYVAAGPGLYFERISSQPDCVRTGACTFAQFAAGPPYFNTTTWSLGVGGALGIDMKVWKANLFIEQGLHVPEILSNWDQRDKTSAPFSIGFRF